MGTPPPSRTYLLVLSHDERSGRTKRRFVTLPDPSMLAWFRRNWNRSDEARTEELRGDVYGMSNIFDDSEGPPPAKDLDLVAWIDRTVYAEQDHVVRLHYLRVETDDDEAPIWWFMFDDEFLAEPDAWAELPSPRTPAEDDDADFALGDGAYDDAADPDDDDRPLDAFERFYRARVAAR